MFFWVFTLKRSEADFFSERSEVHTTHTLNVQHLLGLTILLLVTYLHNTILSEGYASGN